MLKRIEANQIRVGMFVESLEGVWVNMPAFGRRFLVENEAHAHTLRTSPISGIFINTTKGLDIQLSGAAALPVLPARKRAYRRDRSTSILQKKQQEVASMLAETSTVVKNVFNAARDGEDISLDVVALISSRIAQTMEQDGEILINMTRLKSKDETTFIHSISVSALMIRFARYLNMDEETVRILGVSGLLHDIGKISIPNEILTKEGSLSQDEMTLIKMHPSHGHSLLSRGGNMPDVVLDVCLHHHERPDGKGYPMGLAGDEISYFARISSICDVYDAVTSARPYKKPWSLKDTATWMLSRKGTFDRELLHQFFNGVMRF